jgi:hypothetical protein
MGPREGKKRGMRPGCEACLERRGRGACVVKREEVTRK